MKEKIEKADIINLKDFHSIEVAIEKCEKLATPLEITFNNEEFSGKVDWLDKNKRVFVISTNAVDVSVGSELAIHFVRNEYYFSFISKVMQVSQGRVFSHIPTNICGHINRGIHRIQPPKDTVIPIRLKVACFSQLYNEISVDELHDNNIDTLYKEVRKDIPNLNIVLNTINKIIKKKWVLGNIDLSNKLKLPPHIDLLLNKFSAPYFMTDSTIESSYNEEDMDNIMFRQFFHFINFFDNSKKDALISEGKKYYKNSDIFSETWIPIKIFTSLMGYIHVFSDINSNKHITQKDVMFLDSIGQILKESLLKRSLNSKTDTETFQIKIKDIDDNSISFFISDPIFLKIINLDSNVRVSINVFNNWVTVYGKVVRSFFDEKNEGGVAIKLDFSPSRSRDRVYWKRIINYFSQLEK